MNWRAAVLETAVLVAVLAIAGCGSFAPTLPSPDEGYQPPPETFDIYGHVTTFGNQVAEDCLVSVSDGEQVWEAETDANGDYRFEDVSTGSYAVTFSLAGFAADYAVAVVTDRDVEVNANLQGTEGTPADCPDVQMNEPQVNEARGTAIISGTVDRADADELALFVNGEAQLIELAPACNPEAALPDTCGTFENIVVLREGQNLIRVFAANALCTTLGVEQSLTWTPPYDTRFVFRATLTWNDDSADNDLHLWMPNGTEHVFFQHLASENGDVELDVDDREGYGPENMTCRTTTPGRYRLAVGCYWLSGMRSSTAQLRVYTGSLAANDVDRVLGPYQFQGQQSNDGNVELAGMYPVAGDNDYWWRACDIVLLQNGRVSIEIPDSSVLPRAANLALPAIVSPGKP